MYPFLIFRKVGPFYLRISTYGIFVLLGILLTGCIYFLLVENGRQKIISHIIFFTGLLLVFALFSKVTQFLLDFYIKKDEGLTVWALFRQSGSTILGGIIFSIPAVMIFAKIDPLRIVTWQSIDALAVSFPFGHMLGRVGCFFGGCCYGKICNECRWTITYPKNWIINIFREEAIPRGPRIPAPLIASIGLFIIGTALLILFLTSKEKGQAAPLYFILYGLFRFFHEFLRGDNDFRGFIGKFSTGQYLSILLTIIGIILFISFLLRRKKGKTGRPFLPLNGKKPFEKDIFD